MIHNAIGLMSGSSLDGLDIVNVELTEVRGVWNYEVKAATCIAYDKAWKERLLAAPSMSIPDFLNTHTAFGRYLGASVNAFIESNNLTHQVHLIASHGHTVYHNPQQHTSIQVGDGASIAAVTSIATVTDLRNVDVALGGQGAPIVPVAERYLWSDYQFCLNLGGIANISINQSQPLAFDICPANQVLNHFAALKGAAYDDEGKWASAGQVDKEVLHAIQDLPYYQQAAPKSLANTFSRSLIELLRHLSVDDALATMVEHIALQVNKALSQYPKQANSQLLVTGGGALNTFLIQRIIALCPKVEVVVPSREVIQYKEAIAMALIGVLRWREEANVLSSVSGASRDSVGGALWVS